MADIAPKAMDKWDPIFVLEQNNSTPKNQYTAKETKFMITKVGFQIKN